MLKTTIQKITHASTNAFGSVITDYIAQKKELQAFFNVFPSIENIEKFIAEKKAQSIDRKTLHAVLEKQYANINDKKATSSNINSLLHENTFTICTAHQPIIFGGPLYFIYKIAHAIQLAKTLKTALPEYNFVPVFYMGSEDADIAEIGNCNIDGNKIIWKPDIGGACGRISTNSMQEIVAEVLGNLNTQSLFGTELAAIISEAYTTNKNVDEATLHLVHALFGEYGLVVLIPDNADLKKMFASIMRKEMLEKKSVMLVEATTQLLGAHYKTQAHAREINLFYLGNGFRERIECVADKYTVVNTELQFTESELLFTLENNPENFSPNVILRGVFQETILPNVAFIGGGGELAYWLQLKDVFAHYAVPYPPLVLRQSFLLENETNLKSRNQLGLQIEDIFKSKDVLQKQFVQQSADWQMLDAEIAMQNKLMESYKAKASKVLPQLMQSMQAYEARYNKLQLAIHKKFVQHSKRKHADSMQAIEKLKNSMFPNENLQERVENFIPYYNNYGTAFINTIIENCTDFGDEFVILKTENV